MGAGRKAPITDPEGNTITLIEVDGRSRLGALPGVKVNPSGSNQLGTVDPSRRRVVTTTLSEPTRSDAVDVDRFELGTFAFLRARRFGLDHPARRIGNVPTGMLHTSIVLWPDARRASVLDQHAQLHQALQLLGHFARRVVVSTLGRLRLIEGAALFHGPQENPESQASAEEQFTDDVDRRFHYRAHQCLSTNH